MIKIISMLILRFSTGRQIFCIGGLKIYTFSMGTKTFATSADLIDLDKDLDCIT